MKQLGHYETLVKMPKLDFECILYVCEISCDNLGLILRSADIFGVNALYYQQSRHNMDSKHIAKISRQSNIPIHYSKGVESLHELKKSGYQIVALEITNTSIPLRNVSFKNNICLIIGNERYGVPDDMLSIAERSCHIEMVGAHISSLNVSIATSIALYEITQHLLNKKDEDEKWTG